MHTEPADVHGVLQEIRSGGLGARLERGTEVNRKRGDERDGENAGERRHHAADDAPCPPGQRVVEDVEQGPELHSSTISMAPASTDAPSVARTSVTVPAARVRSSFSIFIASTTTTPCRASTRSPVLTSTLTIFPGIGATI